jgi:hypothetical protein
LMASVILLPKPKKVRRPISLVDGNAIIIFFWNGGFAGKG